MNPLISIIIPVYNKAKYLNRCLESLLGQSFEDFEIIIINDGSTDESGTISEYYANKDKRIVYIYKANEGVSSARNRGLDVAKGKYINFVDADDYVLDNYFEDIVNHVNEYEADLYLWGITKLYPNGKKEKCVPQNNGCFDKTDFLSIMIQKQYRDCPGVCGFVSTKLLKREIIQKNNIRFNLDINLAEDYDFFLSYFNIITSAVIFENVGYLYIQESEGSTFLKKM